MLSQAGKSKISTLKQELHKVLQDIDRDEKKLQEETDGIIYNELQKKLGNKNAIEYAKKSSQYGIVLLNFLLDDEKIFSNSMATEERLHKNNDELEMYNLLSNHFQQEDKFFAIIKKAKDLQELHNDSSWQKMLIEYKAKSIWSTEELALLFHRHGLNFLENMDPKCFLKIVEFIKKSGFIVLNELIILSFIQPKIAYIFPKQIGIPSIRNSYSRQIAASLSQLYKEFKPALDLNGIYRFVPGISKETNKLIENIDFQILLYDRVKHSENIQETLESLRPEISTAKKTIVRELELKDALEFKEFEIRYNKLSLPWLNYLKSLPTIDIFLKQESESIAPHSIYFTTASSAIALICLLLSFEKEINAVLKVKFNKSVYTIFDSINAFYNNYQSNPEYKEYIKLIQSAWKNLLDEKIIREPTSAGPSIQLFRSVQTDEEKQRAAKVKELINELKESAYSQPLDLYRAIEMAQSKLLKLNKKDEKLTKNEHEIFKRLQFHAAHFIKLTLEQRYYSEPPQVFKDYLEWKKIPTEQLKLQQYTKDLQNWIKNLELIQDHIPIPSNNSEVLSDPSKPVSLPEEKQYNPELVEKFESILCFFLEPPLSSLKELSDFVKKLCTRAIAISKTITSDPQTLAETLQKLESYLEETKILRSIFFKIKKIVLETRIQDFSSPTRADSSQPFPLYLFDRAKSSPQLYHLVEARDNSNKTERHRVLSPLVLS